MKKVAFGTVWCTVVLLSSLLSLHAEDFWQDTLWIRKLPLGGKNFAKVMFHPDGKSLFATADQYLFRYDVQTGTIISTFEMKSKNAIMNYALTHNRQFVVCGTNGADIEIWHIDTGFVRSKKYSEYGGISGIEVSPDDKTIYAGHAKDNAILSVTDFETGELKEAVDNKGGDIALSPDGTLLVSVTGYSADNRTSTLYEVGSWKKLQSLPPMWKPKFSPLGTHIASIHPRVVEHSVVVYDIINKTTSELTGHKGQLADVCFTNDGKYVLSCTRNEPFENNGYRIWNVETKQLVYTAPPYFNGSGIVVAPANNVIVIGGNGLSGIFAITSPTIISSIDQQPSFSNSPCLEVTPNPSMDILRVNLKLKNNLSNQTIYVCDLRGVTFLSQSFSDDTTGLINIGSLPSGNYIIKVTQGNVVLCSLTFIINR